MRPMPRCETIHRTEKWPYVRRCPNDVDRMSVKIRYRAGNNNLHEMMDLCEQDYLDYIKTLTLEEATEVESKSYNLRQNR